MKYLEDSNNIISLDKNIQESIYRRKNVVYGGGGGVALRI